jgi:hypothetical protein
MPPDSGYDHGGFNRKRRIFQTADIEQGENTAYAQQQNGQPDADGIIDKLAGYIH